MRRDKAECGKVEVRTENVAGRSWTPQPLAITPGAASRQNDNVLVGVYEKHPEGKGMPISFHSSEISSSVSFGAPRPSDPGSKAPVRYCKSTNETSGLSQGVPLSKEMGA